MDLLTVLQYDGLPLIDGRDPTGIDKFGAAGPEKTTIPEKLFVVFQDLGYQ